MDTRKGCAKTLGLSRVISGRRGSCTKLRLHGAPMGWYSQQPCAFCRMLVFAPRVLWNTSPRVKLIYSS